MKVGRDSLSTKSQLQVDGKTYHYFSLKEAEQKILKESVVFLTRLKFFLKIYYVLRMRARLLPKTLKQLQTGCIIKRPNMKLHLDLHAS